VYSSGTRSRVHGLETEPMADSPAFEFACDELERATSLDRLEARGTVRLALKEAGLEASSITPSQMAAVMTKLLPNELASRGVEGGDAICAAIASGLAQLPEEAAGDTPEAVFLRLGGNA